MSFDPLRHHRRSIRLHGREYVQPGAYFVTICTKDRACIFGNVRNGIMELNAWGIMAQECWLEIPRHFPHVLQDSFVVMPNHVHGIIVIVDQSEIAKMAQHAAPLHPESMNDHHEWKNVSAGSLNAMVRSYKAAVTMNIRVSQRDPFIQVWQRNFHEHIIREGVSIDRIREYIIGNPGRWDEDPENPRKSS